MGGDGPTEGDDILHGGDGDDTLTGLGGDDIIDGGAGDDTIDGGDGLDTAHGGAGNDDFDVGPGGDLLYGDEGYDFFYSSFSVAISAGGAIFDGGAGNDTFFLGGINDYTAIGGEGADDLRTSNSSNGISLVGGAGDDTFRLTNSAATIDAGEGDDHIRLGGGTYAITLGAGRDFVSIELQVGGTTTFTDFTPGEQGDTLSLRHFFGEDALQPGGRLTISQLGANTVIADSETDAQFVFLDVLAADLGYHNFQLSNPLTNPPDRVIEDTSANPQNAATLIGFDGNDIIRGFGGDDFLIGAGGNDSIEGGDGNDTLHTSTGDDVLDGGAGIDTAILRTPGRVVADLRIAGLQDTGWGSFVLSGIENLIGNTGDGDELTGNAGANLLDGNTGADTMTGLSGNDRYFVDHANDRIVEGAAEGVDDRAFTSVSYALGAGVHVEQLAITDAAGIRAINLTGNELVNAITGNDGANVLDGKAGADMLTGLGGDDWYVVDNAADVVVEVAGGGSNDRISASVDYTLAAGVQVERMTTSDNLAGTAINLTGNELANIIYGNAGANVLDGRAGNDTFVGGLGNDAMNGGLGDDLFYVDSAGDTVLEVAGQGADRVLASVSYTLGASANVETLTTSSNTGTGAINLTGNGIANMIYGNAGANVLDGRGGADLLVGLGGNDWYHVDNAADAVIESVGGGTADRVFASVSYTLSAGVQVELLTTSNNAGTGAINLTGNTLANTIYGNAGANVLDGKGGADILVGLAGTDSFAFTTTLGAGNVDTVSGFIVPDDTIRLENAVFTGLAAGGLAAGAFNTGTAATQADDRVIYNSATGALLFDADGLGGAAGVQFATLAAGLALTSADFLVI